MAVSPGHVRVWWRIDVAGLIVPALAPRTANRRRRLRARWKRLLFKEHVNDVIARLITLIY